MERFRKAALTASMAAAISLFPGVSWAKKAPKAGPIIRPIAEAPGERCPSDMNGEIMRRMAKPNRISEFFNILSEKGLHYNWNFVRMKKEVDAYLKASARFKRKEDTLLKLAGEIEGAYRDSVHATIMAYAKDSDVDVAKEIFSTLASCGYIDRRSILKQMKTQIALGKDRPDAAAEGEYRGWVTGPPAESVKVETSESRTKSEIDELFETGMKSIREKR